MSDHTAADAPLATDPARQRLALAQTALLSSLVAGTPVPAGFDPGRIRVQTLALAGKRAAVVGKVAPELSLILGAGYRPAFLRYAAAHPPAGGYRRDALGFAEYLLCTPGASDLDPRSRQELADWWAHRSGPEPLTGNSARRIHRTRDALRRLRPRQTLWATR